MAVADVCAQALETDVFQTPRAGDDSAAWDPARTARFSVVGLTLHGPYFQRGFAWVDKVFGATMCSTNLVKWRVLAKKVATTQFVLNPPFMVLLFGWMAVLESKRFPDEVVDNVVVKWPSAFWAGNLFWPVANFINFRFLGPAHRVAYVASCGAVWNTFISWLNKRVDTERELEAQSEHLGVAASADSDKVAARGG